MLFSETIDFFYCENHRDHIKTVLKNAEFLDVIETVTYRLSNHGLLTG